MIATSIVLIKPVLNKFQGDVGKQLWFAGFWLIPVFLNEPITKRRVIAILIAMAGAYLVFIG